MTFILLYLRKPLKIKKFVSYYIFSMILKQLTARYIVDIKDEVPPIGGTQTWLYRAYLKTFRYNINCWRKKWNRVNDTNIQDRFCKAGVRMGYIDKVVCTILPRPGENTIGLDAYKKYRKKAMDHFAFADKEHTIS
jgi:hypothetical protein